MKILYAAFAAYIALSLNAGLAHDRVISANTPPDPTIGRIVAIQTLRYPAPDGCAVVGGWEDGAIVAYCVSGTWLTHGPDADDTWTAYDGPILDVWVERAQG